MATPLEFKVIANASQYKAEMAQVKAIAQGINKGGGGGHGGMSGLRAGGGQSGMIREAIVIMREIGRGNWARVPGSISLMLQYMGAFSKILKVTHSDLAQHALDLEKEAQAMTKAAQVEAMRAGTSKLRQDSAKAMLAAEVAQTAANDAAVVANQMAAASSTEAAAFEATAAAAKVKASNLAIIAKQREAAAYAEAAEIEGAATTVALGPIGWLIAAIVALGAAVYLTVNHFKALAQRQLNLDDAMTGVNTKAERQTNRMIEAAEAARKLAVEIGSLYKHQKSLSEISDEAVESLQRNAQAEMEIAKEKRQTRLDEIDLAEKMHKISAQEATRQRMAIEIDTIKNEMALKSNSLVDEQKQRLKDYEDAKKTARKSAADHKAKEEASGPAGPEGAAKKTALEEAEKKEKHLAAWVDALDKQKRERDLPGPMNWARKQLTAGMGDAYKPVVKVGGEEMPGASRKDIAAQWAAATKERERLKANLEPSQVAAVEAKAKMESDAASVLKLGKDVDEVAQAITDNSSNAQREADEKLKRANLKGSAKLYEEGQQGVTKGYGLNRQQQVGAYAATPPDFKKLVDAAIRTAQNTENLKGKSFNPVGSTPAKFGPGHH